MKRFNSHLMVLLCLTAITSSAIGDSADAPYAAEQCTKYNRPKPKNVRLTDADARKCCAEFAGDVEIGQQKTFTAECVKRVIASENQKASAAPKGAGNLSATPSNPNSTTITTSKLASEEPAVGVVKQPNPSPSQTQAQDTGVQKIKQGIDTLQNFKGFLK